MGERHFQYLQFHDLQKICERISGAAQHVGDALFVSQVQTSGMRKQATC